MLNVREAQNVMYKLYLSALIGIFCSTALLWNIKVNAATEGKTRIEALEDQCTKNNARICYELAEQLEIFAKEKEDFARVLELLNKSCDLDYAGACVDLGYILISRAKPYYTYRLYKEDDHRALELSYKACALHAEEGCNNYGVLYEHGRGTEQDINIALFNYNLACEMGSTKGCENYRRLAETIRE